MQAESSTLTVTNTTDYSFGLSFAPNGNVLTANDSVNGNWNYSYDQFNRLVCSNLVSNGTCASPTNGTQTYSYVYDRFGNRWQQNGPQSFVATFTGNNPGAPANNNRIDGYSYDAAGNLLYDGTHHYFYDAENRLIQVDGTLGTCAAGSTTGTTACYYYDARGNRVFRTGFTNDTCDATGKRGYVYDLAGHWLAEVNESAGTGCNAEVYAGNRHVATADGAFHFDHTDWLGTSRLRTDYGYTTSHGYWLGQSCTSLPFGDGLNCSNFGPNFALHFTGKERDFETGLDNFGARYNSSSFGRFLSPDPKSVGVHLLDPQTLNRYAYTRDNPLLFVDPDGKDLEKAWHDTVRFFKSLSAKSTVGLGYEAHTELGKIEAKAGGAAKGSIEISAEGVKLSRSASIGVEAGAKGAKVGESISAEQTVMTIKDGTITGTEKPEVTITDTSGLFGGNVESSKDKVGIGLELPADILPVVGGLDIEATKEGWDALKDAGKEVRESLRNPEPPRAPTPPPPPACATDPNKKC